MNFLMLQIIVHIIFVFQEYISVRKGLHPLSVHLGIAASNIAGMHEYVGASGAAQYDTSQFVEAVRGIQMYQQHPYIPPQMEYDIIHQDGKMKILKPKGTSSEGTKATPPVLLVPSLINKSTILDIDENMSLLRWLNAGGANAYLLDWGDITSGGDELTMSSLITEQLTGAIRAVSAINGSPIDLIGYCMGGALCIGAASLPTAPVRRIVLLATPWDFHDDANIFAKNVRIWSRYVEPIINERGYLPSEWIQALFASYDPNGSVQKFTKFSTMDQDGSDAHLFIAVEDWLNDGVNLPKNIAHHCMNEWFMDNALLKNSWRLDSSNLNLENTNQEVLIVASNKDRLVPLSCAVSARRTLKNAKISTIEGGAGHIGLVIGKAAIREVWSPIFEWLQK